jgi:hypothetical protein
VDAHTKDNRDKRKALQERRNGLSKQMEFLGQTIQEGNSKVNNLYAGIETNLALAKHAETWEWKEVNPIRGVSRMPTFEEVWDDIQRRLPIGIEIPNWSYDGRTRGTTRIDEKYYYEIWVSGKSTTKSREVKRDDFKKLYEIWDRYKHGQIRRDEISDLSRNSTYIFTILHWRETDQETPE